MTCDDALHLVEAIAAGDLEVEERIRAHFESCPRCAAALASARRLERMLQARQVPQPPDGFTSAVLARIHSDRWRSEQHVDRIFNIGIAAAVVLVVAGIAALTNIDMVLATAGMLVGLMARAGGGAIQQAAPTVLTYVGAAGLLMSTLLMWWWAERRLTL